MRNRTRAMAVALVVGCVWAVHQQMGTEADPTSGKAAVPSRSTRSLPKKKTRRAVIPRPQAPVPPKRRPDAEQATEQDQKAPTATEQAVRHAVKARIDQIKDNITSCISAWMAHDPDLNGRVELGVLLDADALQEAWVEDHSDIPFGPRSCFSAAIYDADWRGVAKEPTELVLPFAFSQGIHEDEEAADTADID